MSFKLQNLTIMANPAKTGVVPAIWCYYNADGDTLTSAGYFEEGCGVRNNDKVLVVSTTNADVPEWYYATVSGKTVTLTACTKLKLSDLDDVIISELADGDKLTYNGDDEHWENNA